MRRRQTFDTNLTLNAVNLNGINKAGQPTSSTQTTSPDEQQYGQSKPVAYGGGNLKINADQITLAAGDKSIQGFDKVTFKAKEIVAQGTGSVTITSGEAVPTVHSLVLQAARSQERTIPT